MMTVVAAGMVIFLFHAGRNFYIITTLLFSKIRGVETGKSHVEAVVSAQELQLITSNTVIESVFLHVWFERLIQNVLVNIFDGSCCKLFSMSSYFQIINNCYDNVNHDKFVFTNSLSNILVIIVNVLTNLSR